MRSRSFVFTRQSSPPCPAFKWKTPKKHQASPRILPAIRKPLFLIKGILTKGPCIFLTNIEHRSFSLKRIPAKISILLILIVLLFYQKIQFLISKNELREGALPSFAGREQSPWVAGASPLWRNNYGQSFLRHKHRKNKRWGNIPTTLLGEVKDRLQKNQSSASPTTVGRYCLTP